MSSFVFIQAGGLQGEANSLMWPPAVFRAALMNGILSRRSWAMLKESSEGSGSVT